MSFLGSWLFLHGAPGRKLIRDSWDQYSWREEKAARGVCVVGGSQAEMQSQERLS
jgi:hypothetical protein